MVVAGSGNRVVKIRYIRDTLLFSQQEAISACCVPVVKIRYIRDTLLFSQQAHNSLKWTQICLQQRLIIHQWKATDEPV